jgi:predicted amidophosphoribosyltransferase
MKCHSCGKEIDESSFSPGLAYCPYCGQQLEAARVQFCPYCGQKLAAETNFCPHCGKKLAPVKKKAITEQAVRDFIEEKAKPIAKAIRSTLGRERKIRKLYKQWTEFSDLPQEEIPSMDTIRQMSAKEKAREESQPDDSEED